MIRLVARHLEFYIQKISWLGLSSDVPKLRPEKCHSASPCSCAGGAEADTVHGGQ
jgi:hypothetical protein